MLTALRVKNLALVESVRLDLQPGLNVITGETGAGKSILLGALSLLLGERADRKYIREGADACGAEAVFSLKEPDEVNALLEEFGVTPCEDGQLIIRRIVKATGASQNLVNDCPVTLQALKSLGERLVDMHGPHDHQSLLRPAFQLDLLDAFGRSDKELAAYRETWERRRALEERRAALTGDTTDVDAQLDLLTYRVKEIEEAEPKEGEEEAVLAEHAVVSNAQRVLELGAAANAAIMDGEGAAFDALALAQRNLEELARIMPEAAAWQEEARSAAVQLQGLSSAIAGAMDKIEGDPARLPYKWGWPRKARVLTQRTCDVLRRSGNYTVDVMVRTKSGATRVAAELARFRLRAQKSSSHMAQRAGTQPAQIGSRTACLAS